MNEINARQEQLLSDIIREFYRTAQPVGSSWLVKKYYSDLSSATIRNEMSLLEKEGYIIQPHTSAGRMPTEKGYNYYLNNLAKEIELSKNNKQVIVDFLQITELGQARIRNLAKLIAELSNETVFVAFNKNDFYYTGISNLLAKPEFFSQELILNVSKVIDHFDEVLSVIFNKIDNSIETLIGQNNPFNGGCATIITKKPSGQEAEHILGILGPMRMNYEKNRALLKYIKEIY